MVKKTVKKKSKKKVEIKEKGEKPENEEEIGAVTHYFTNIGVAVIEIKNSKLNVGDQIHIKGATSDFKQKVSSMQIEHEKVQTAKKGDAIGLKVKEHVREHDTVYLVK
ncbi:MAG: hypothetical protein ABII01_04850 [Candidatus Woesearchaeota archaeon]